MALELYTEKGDQGYFLNGKIYPMATIRPLPGGTIHFNKKAIVTFNLKTEGFVQIYKDEELIFFKHIDSQEEGAYKIDMRNRSLSFSPKGFVRKYGHTKTTRYEIKFNEDLKMCFINLSKRKRKK